MEVDVHLTRTVGLVTTLTLRSNAPSPTCFTAAMRHTDPCYAPWLSADANDLPMLHFQKEFNHCLQQCSDLNLPKYR